MAKGQHRNEMGCPDAAARNDAAGKYPGRAALGSGFAGMDKQSEGRIAGEQTDEDRQSNEARVVLNDDAIIDC